MYVIRLDNGQRWKVRQAVSLKAACNAIVNARVSGSVGSATLVNGTLIADVVRINSDNSERQPYTAAY